MSKEVMRPEAFAHSKTKALPEDIALPSEAHRAEMEELYGTLLSSFQQGKIVTGHIVTVDSDGVLVDIGYKSRGLIPKYEFSAHELKNLKTGQELEVLLETLENIDGGVVLSYEQAKAMRSWNAIVKLFEENKPVEGLVTHKVKGGLNVDIGIPAFLPGSQIDLQRVTDFDQYVGQSITGYILKINKKRGNVIMSRRKYLTLQRSDSRKKVLDTLQEGQTVQGVVKNITNYGVFIDIGGVDGLLHIHDMTWGRIEHPSDLVRIGDTITVKVLSFNKELEKISLGLKQLSETPWAEIDQTLKVGQRIKGKIASIANYGLFVEVAPGIEGLVHISEISWTERITNLANRFQVGEEIEVLIVAIDKDLRRMSLSIKQLEQSPWDVINQEFSIGQRIKGKVSNIIDAGIFVQLLPGIDGMVRVSDLSWTEHVDHPASKYKVGQEVEAVVLAINKEQKRISLGIKQLESDPWETANRDFPVNSVVDGEISKITNFGAFVRLSSGIEGLIHNSTLQEEFGKRAEDMLKPGQKEQFRVVNVNKEEHKLGLSMRLDGRKEETSRPAPERKRQERQSSSKDTQSYQSDDHAVTNANQPSRMKGALQLALEEAMSKADKKSE